MTWQLISVLPTDTSTNLIGVESLEEVHSLLEKIYDFLLWDIVGVAAGSQSANSISMFAPLVLPETLIVSLIVFPICVHVIE